MRLFKILNEAAGRIKMGGRIRNGSITHHFETSHGEISVNITYARSPGEARTRMHPGTQPEAEIVDIVVTDAPFDLDYPIDYEVMLKKLPYEIANEVNDEFESDYDDIDMKMHEDADEQESEDAERYAAHEEEMWDARREEEMLDARREERRYND